jgi:hypothetical protein
MEALLSVLNADGSNNLFMKAGAVERELPGSAVSPAGLRTQARQRARAKAG